MENTKKEPDYWKRRAKDFEKVFKNQEENAKNGRPKAFSSPSHFWETAILYFESCDSEPWNKTDYKGKDADKVTIPTQNPYLWSGFDDFCLEKGICTSAKDYRTAMRNPDHRDGMYKDFAEVVRAVDGIMRRQKISGALVNAYNSNLVARLEGLADKTENEVTVKETKIGYD